MLVNPVTVLGLGQGLLKDGDLHTEIFRMPLEKWAVHTGWWVLSGSAEAEAPGDGCPALKAERGLAEPPATQHVPLSWPHPEAGGEAALPPGGTGNFLSVSWPRNGCSVPPHPVLISSHTGHC